MKSIVNSNSETVAYLDSSGNLDVLGRVRVNENNQSVQLPTMDEATKEVLKQLYINYDERPLTDSNRCKFNSNTGYFEMNGLTDLTWEDMEAIFRAGPNLLPYFATRGTSVNARTNYCNEMQDFYKGQGRGWWYSNFVANAPISGCPIEVLCLLRMKANNAAAPFDSLGELTRVIGTIDVNNSTNSWWFQRCPNLTYVELNGIVNSIYLFTGKNSAAKGITYACMSYIVTNASSVTSKTITTNSTLYSYLTGTATPPETTGGTSAQWQQLLTDLQGKGWTVASE